MNINMMYTFCANEMKITSKNYVIFYIDRGLGEE